MDTYICSKSTETFKGIVNTKFRIVVISGKKGSKSYTEVSMVPFLKKYTESKYGKMLRFDKTEWLHG